MRYFGSKATTAATVAAHAAKLFGDAFLGATMCDPFGGLGTVASAFKQAGWRVSVSDHLLFPHYYQRARLSRSAPPSFRSARNHLRLAHAADLQSFLQALPGRPGWVGNHYAKKRRFFTTANAARIDATWQTVRAWRRSGLLDDHEYAFVLASLIDSIDRVANTAGTYYAHLKQMTRRALHEFDFRFLAPVAGPFRAKCTQGDALDVIATRHFDVLYLDPPYSARAYDRYYHLPQTIAGGVPREAVGLSGVPLEPSITSRFESPRTAAQAFADLVDAARCSVLLVQYADDGLISLRRIRQILRTRGKLVEKRLSTIGYTTRQQPRAASHVLFTVTSA